MPCPECQADPHGECSDHELLRLRAERDAALEASRERGRAHAWPIDPTANMRRAPLYELIRERGD